MLLLQVYKSIEVPGFPWEWSNEYVLASGVTPNSDAGRALLWTVAQAERAFHLPQVRFHRATVQQYSAVSGGSLAPDAGVIALGGAHGQRGDVNSPPLSPEFFLRVEKETPIGRNGNFWFRGCLCEQDVQIGVDKRWHLTTAQQWQNTINAFWTGDAAGVLNLLRVPYRAGTTRTPESFKPVSRLVSASVIKANAQHRAKQGITPNGLASYIKQGNYAVMAASLFQEMRNWQQLGVEFNPGEFLMRTQLVVASAKITSDELAGYFKDADMDSNNGEVPPIVRYPPEPNALLSICQTCAGITDQDLQSLLSIHTYTHYDGQQYVSSENLDILIDMVEKYLNYSGMWGEFDWLNPKAY